MYVYKLPWEESTTKFAGGETWTRVVGSAKEEARASKTLLPVVMLHGGPGLCSRYLEPMELLGQTARRLAFYDQVAGLSGGPSWSQSANASETLSAKIWDAPRSTAAGSAPGTRPQVKHTAWSSS
jgi:pimeloyl-ACP methyl ester carboxylesterase